MPKNRTLLFVGGLALVRFFALSALNQRASTAETPTPPVPAPAGPPIDAPLVQADPAEVPDCPPELSAAFSNNALVLEALPASERSSLNVWPAEVEAVLLERYAGPVHIWCVGSVATFADAIEPIEPTPVYVASAVAVPKSLVLVAADELPASVVTGVAGRPIVDWINAQPR